MRTSSTLLFATIFTALLAGCGGAEPESASTGAEVGLKSWRSGESARDDDRAAGGTSPTATAVSSAAASGRLLASNCFNCHGTDGHPNGGFDSLAGDSAAEIVKTLKEMAAKSPQDGGIMRAHSMGYTEEQMWRLGSYFASLR